MHMLREHDIGGYSEGRVVFLGTWAPRLISIGCDVSQNHVTHTSGTDCTPCTAGLGFKTIQ